MPGDYNNRLFVPGIATSNGSSHSSSSSASRTVPAASRPLLDVAYTVQTHSPARLASLPAASAASQPRVKFSEPPTSSRYERGSRRLSGHARSHSVTAGVSSTPSDHSATRDPLSHHNSIRRSSAIQVEPVLDIADDLLQPRQRRQHGYDLELISERAERRPSVYVHTERSSRLGRLSDNFLGGPSPMKPSISPAHPNSRSHVASLTRGSSVRERSATTSVPFPGTSRTTERSIPRKPVPSSAYSAQGGGDGAPRTRTISAPVTCDSDFHPVAGSGRSKVWGTSMFAAQS